MGFTSRPLGFIERSKVVAVTDGSASVIDAEMAGFATDDTGKKWALMSFQDYYGNFYVSFIDPINGQVNPVTGKMFLVDTLLAPVTELTSPNIAVAAVNITGNTITGAAGTFSAVTPLQGIAITAGIPTVPANTTVTAVSANGSTVTLSAAATGAGTVSVTFGWTLPTVNGGYPYGDQSRNGPDPILFAPLGEEIGVGWIYTKLVTDTNPLCLTGRNTQLYIARLCQRSNKTFYFTYQLIPNSLGATNVFGSQNDADDLPAMVHSFGSGQINWIRTMARNSDGSWVNTTSGQMPGNPPGWLFIPRSTLTDPIRYNLCVRSGEINACNIDTGAYTVLTVSSNATFLSFPRMIITSEITGNPELLLICPLSDNQGVTLSAIAVFRSSTRTIGGVWTRYRTLRPPIAQRFVGSVEPFVNDKGKACVFMFASPVLTESTNNTDVWLIEVVSQVSTQSSPCGIEARRQDPEAVVTAHGTFVYYASPNSLGNAVLYRSNVTT